MFKPYIASETQVKEFTLKAVFLGILLGVIFGIGNTYLGLKVGMTVSASIPSAVLSMVILRAFFRRSTILEHNIVQTIASVGEGLAAGVIFTVPALFILGEHPPPIKTAFLAFLGGILGVLFMIPLRRYIIVQEHGKLPFPEGTACAAILKSGESSRTKGVVAFIGIVVGALYKGCSNILNLWCEAPVFYFSKGALGFDATPALLGVGYIIGPRIASLLFAGGVFGWWVFIPLIKMFASPVELIYPGIIPVAHMSSGEIWSHYIRYIGAGSVAVGGLLSLVKMVPIIWKSIHASVGELIKIAGNTPGLRTDRDISLRWLVLGSLAIILILAAFPHLDMNLLTVLLLVILGFFFVAVTSVTVGIVGSTSNPVSGMTITTVLITCLVFLALGWTERIYLIAALTLAIVVNVAICIAGATSQDLKTGYILGATPRNQQIAEIVGIVLPILAISGTLSLLHQAYGLGSSLLPAPQGTMMALIVTGVIQGNIPLTLVFVGVIVGLVLQILRIPILPFAVGLYLPFSLSVSIMVGGVVAWWVRYRTQDEEIFEKGILLSSGLVAGDACMGVAVALFTVMGWLQVSSEPYFSDKVAMLLFFILALALGKFTLHRKR